MELMICPERLNEFNTSTGHKRMSFSSIYMEVVDIIRQLGDEEVVSRAFMDELYQIRFAGEPKEMATCINMVLQYFCAGKCRFAQAGLERLK